MDYLTALQNHLLNCPVNLKRHKDPQPFPCGLLGIDPIDNLDPVIVRFPQMHAFIEAGNRKDVEAQRRLSVPLVWSEVEVLEHRT